MSPASGGKVVVKVTLKQALASPPAGFTVNNPPRIAFDFPNTTNALGRSTQEVGEGDLRSINVVQAGDRTRLVLNLSRAAGYDTQIDGRDAAHHPAGHNGRRQSGGRDHPIRRSSARRFTTCAARYRFPPRQCR